MYSTDDDLFSQRRTQKKFQRPQTTTFRQQCASREGVAPSDNSSDDFANERDPIWRRQRERTTEGVTERTGRRAASGEHGAVNEAGSDSSDFEYEPGKGTALLSRRAVKKTGCRREKPAAVKAATKEENANSSGSSSLCACVVQPKKRTTQLLDSYTRSAAREEERPKQRERRRAETKAPLPRSALESAVQKLDSNLSAGFTANKEEMQALSKLVAACRDEIQSKRNLTDMAEEIKTFVGGQLRKGIDKAVLSAVMKLNEKVRSDAEQSNAKMELIMKGLMESYDLICEKVGDMTDIYRSLATRLEEATPRDVVPEQKRRPRSSSRPKTQSRRRSASLGTPSREQSVYRNVPACSTISPDDWRGSDRQNETPNAARGEVLSLQRSVDELEEKTKQCWFEISDVRDRHTKRHRQTRQQLRKLTEDFAHSQSAAACKDKYIAEQISDLSRQLSNIEDALVVAEKARLKSDNTTSDIEAYVTQIYDACKTTLKNVDVRYHKLKQCYRELRQQNATSEAKCDALAESVSQLYRSRPPHTNKHTS